MLLISSPRFGQCSRSSTRIINWAPTGCLLAALHQYPLLAESVSTRRRQEADFRRGGPANQSRLAATPGETRYRPVADLRRHRPNTRLRLVGAVQVWPSSSRYSRERTFIHTRRKSRLSPANRTEVSGGAVAHHRQATSLGRKAFRQRVTGAIDLLVNTMPSADCCLVGTSGTASTI